MRTLKKANLDLESIEQSASRHFSFFLLGSLAVLVFVALIAVTVFFISVRGAEQTMVPNVTGKELTSALLELQQKELYPRIQLKYSWTSADKGHILEQDPAPGTIVKAGRRIKLVVSRGVIVDKVENYIGQNLDDVKMHLQTLFATTARPLLSLKEPPDYIYSPEPAGTILEQNPLGGFEVSGPTVLEFIVSRGPENAMVKVPELSGIALGTAIERLKQAGVHADFSLRPARMGERDQTIVTQEPAANTWIAANKRVNLTIAVPATLPAGEVFGLLEYELPENPYPLNVRVETISEEGHRGTLFSADHPGGSFTLPYRLPEGTILVLSVLNRELTRIPAQAAVLLPQESTAPTQQ